MKVNDLIEIPVILEENESERVGSIFVRKEFLQYFPAWNINVAMKKVDNVVSKQKTYSFQGQLSPSEGAVKWYQDQMDSLGVKKSCNCKS